MATISKTRSLACCAAMTLMLVSPGFAAGGGGGSSMPSQSASDYNPAEEYRKGADAFRAGNYADAAKAFKRVTTALPKNAMAQYLLGASHLAMGNFKKAKNPLEAAVKNDATMIDAKRDLGITHAKLGNAEKASAQMAALKTMQQACADSCADAAKYADAVVKLEAAMAAGKQATDPVEPTIRLAQASAADVTYVSAVSLINEKRYPEAIAMLEDALWTTGPHPDVLTYLGFANRKLQNFNVAEAYYRDALEIAPRHRGALEYYGELKLERGDISGATAHLAKLENICGFGCQEADELRRWIAEARPSAS